MLPCNPAAYVTPVTANDPELRQAAGVFAIWSQSQGVLVSGSHHAPHAHAVLSLAVTLRMKLHPSGVLMRLAQFVRRSKSQRERSGCGLRAATNLRLHVFYSHCRNGALPIGAYEAGTIGTGLQRRSGCRLRVFHRVPDSELSKP